MTEPYPFPTSADEFADKRVLVTGGTRGIGAAVVRRFKLAGARVVATARSAPAHAVDGVLQEHRLLMTAHHGLEHSNEHIRIHSAHLPGARQTVSAASAVNAKGGFWCARAGKMYRTSRSVP
jgi:NAD(P)-dependent dehydrogenase (short-subunit alcohol dehydrogenase family)